ncbi:lytic transglycosylase [Bifidobacterium margollesii]|uniref:Lytic transglycosylase n=1 Tax=Bifidobacterium margollesii TaxID=2020964 RepID=A0A2N5J9W6_9BIFI|nr:G5 domain-containing protein [Bifidobacterium margollesii]PLS31014.1 lytic transglycosylase [Bifidobacterium margollesii]
MARRWTPQRFMTLRRIRVAICAVTVTVACVLGFALTTHKTIALEVNGKKQTVQTYAISVDRLLEEQHIDVKTHDLVQSTSGDILANHAVVTVRSAYQATINIDGKEVPFWTVATSADQLLGFFNDNEEQATKVTVDIKNVYNQLTGGMVINKNGPVEVIADGKTSEAPNGKLPAASILDSKGIVLGKEDRVSVEKNGSSTVLRVKRVTHGTTSKTVSIPYTTQTVYDDSLEPGTTVIRQQGEAGEKKQTFNTTYVDGKAETAVLAKEETTKIAVDEIIAVGPEKPAETPSTSPSDGSSSDADKNDTADKNDSSNDNDQQKTDSKPATKPSSEPSKTSGSSNSGSSNNSGSTGSNQSTPKPTAKPTQTQTSKPTQKPTATSKPNNSGSSNSGSSNNSGSSSHSGLWHPTVAQAQAYARGAAAQRGWTGSEWDALVWLWNKESGWDWSADNPWSDAYGIPQALPGSKMGTGWQDDGAVQINWGLQYIAERYGSPTQAKAYWLKHNWY